MRRQLARALTSLWLILLVAVGVRFGYAWDQQRQIPDERLVARFQQETGNIASALAMGKGFSSPWLRESGPTAYLAPVYPLLLAGVFRIFGIETIHSFFAAAALNILFSAAACLPVFYAGKRLAGLGVASVAAWFWALLPNAVVFPFEWIWDTSLSALLGATLLWATLAVAESSRRRDWSLYGLLWGFALLTNPALGSLLPFLIGWAAWRARGHGLAARLQRPGLAVGCAILCCVPWTVRNYAVFHRFVPLRSNLGLELYIENNENYSAHPPPWPYNITREREIYRFFRMGEPAFMKEEMHKALQFIFSHPRAELRLCRLRFISFWMGTPSPLEDFLDTRSLFLRTVFLASLLLVLGTFAGIVILFRRRDSFAFPLASFPAIFPLIYYITHASLRYRHPIDPVLVLFSAIAVSALFATHGPLLHKLAD
jgi:Dolichyl-phosphate-mannose-protein mannosyltransferase